MSDTATPRYVVRPEYNTLYVKACVWDTQRPDGMKGSRVHSFHRTTAEAKTAADQLNKEHEEHTR